MRKLVSFIASLAAVVSLWGADAKTQHLDLRVKGMTCADCSKKISTALLKIDGVKSADVSHSGKVAKVDFDSAKVARKDLEAAIEKAGYQVEKDGTPKG